MGGFVKLAVKTIEGDFSSVKGNFTLVVGRWNSFVVESLLDGALDALKRHGIKDEQLTVIRAPGAYELELASVPSEWADSALAAVSIRQLALTGLHPRAVTDTARHAAAVTESEKLTGAEKEAIALSGAGKAKGA